MRRDVRNRSRIYRVQQARNSDRGVDSAHNRLVIRCSANERASIQRFPAVLHALIDGIWFTANS